MPRALRVPKHGRLQAEQQQRLAFQHPAAQEVQQAAQRLLAQPRTAAQGHAVPLCARRGAARGVRGARCGATRARQAGRVREETQQRGLASLQASMLSSRRGELLRLAPREPVALRQPAATSSSRTHPVRHQVVRHSQQLIFRGQPNVALQRVQPVLRLLHRARAQLRVPQALHVSQRRKAAPAKLPGRTKYWRRGVLRVMQQGSACTQPQTWRSARRAARQQSHGHLSLRRGNGVAVHERDDPPARPLRAAAAAPGALPSRGLGCVVVCEDAILHAMRSIRVPGMGGWPYGKQQNTLSMNSLRRHTRLSCALRFMRKPTSSACSQHIARH